MNITYKKSFKYEPNQKIHVNLKRGHSLDIFALKSHYGYRHGLPGVDISLDDQRVGKTDSFGHFTINYKGSIGDLVEIGLKSKQHLPARFSTDYIINRSMSLVKYFGNPSPEPVRVLTLPVQAAGRLKGKTLSTFTGNLNDKLSRNLKREFFNSPSFTNISEKDDHLSNRSWIKNLGKGWKNQSIKSKVDAVLVPTVVLHDPMQLELKLIDSSGKTLAAAKENLKSFTDNKAVRSGVKSLSKKIVRNFPFEGTITENENENENDVFTINLGFGEGRAIKSGDIFDIYGIQSDIKGQKKTHSKIGSASVVSTREYTSKIKVISKFPRAIIQVGNKVTFKGSPKQGSGNLAIFVKEPSTGRGIPQANVYFKEKWLGATNKKGLITIHQNDNDRGLLKVIKNGYETLSKETKLGKIGRMEIPLRQVTAFLMVDSQPSNLNVFLDKKFIGKTPFKESVPVPSGFTKLEILGENGLKNYKQVLDLDEGTLDLSGENKIIMEKDYISEAKNMINGGRFQDAVDLLNKMATSHSDYKHGQHQAGVVYMSLLRQPHLAAKAFYNVTSDPEVKSYRDKRFIGSHINEGVSLHLVAKELESEDETDAAVAHYLKSTEVLESVKSHLRFIKKDNYQQAFDNVFYYKALSHQNIWSINKSAEQLLLAQDAWLSLLDSRNSKKTDNTLVKNASIYLRQVELAINQNTGKRL